MTECAADCTPLPDVDNSRQTHDVQPWYQMDIGFVLGARLKGSWMDQGWGNQKGAIHARVATPGGTPLFPWRRVGPYPAPHEETEFDIEIPKEFFLGEVPTALLCVQEHTSNSIRVPGGDPDLIATATYGEGDRRKDVTDIVRRELAAGKPVTATNNLFGDPCPGVPKVLTITLKEDANGESAAPMPDDARLELGFEVGGGGGHSLRILRASLYLEKAKKVLTATFAPPEVTIFTMAGETFATLRDVAAEETEESLADRICEAVQDILGPGKGFKVIMSGTNQVISG